MLLNPPSKYAKNVVRDLFYGCWCKGKRIASTSFPPTTLLYIATVLERDNHDVKLLDSQAEGIVLEDVKKIVSNEAPDILVIPTATMTFNEDMETLKEIKEISDATILAFGSHVTFRPKDSLKNRIIDFLVMREPEFVIRDFARAKEKGMDLKKINGLGFKINKKILTNAPYPFINPLDQLPIPDRKYILDFAYFNPLVKRLPWTTALTSRGCPGRCMFCSSPSFYGNKLRFRSAANVLDEIEYLHNVGYKEIFFRDETFTAHRSRLIDICNGIKERRIDISWICNGRIDTVDLKTLKMMKNAGCHMIKFGVESGVQKILDNINKGIKIEMTRNVFKWAHEVGMETHAHMMFGCVGETWDTINKTIKFLKEIDPTTVTCGAFTPYPGTKLFELIENKIPEIGDGSQCNLSMLHTKGFHNDLISELSDEEVGKAVRMLYRKFYLRPSYILKRLSAIRSLDQFRRIVSAGINVLSFSIERED